MSTTKRHGNLVAGVVSSGVNKLKELLKIKKMEIFHEETPLVYWGKGDSLTKLVDVTDSENIGDTDDFINETIHYLKYIQPDFMLFKENPYLENKRHTRVAGLPDLIIEVWSRGNSQDERDFKLRLYSTSEITEHWYIEQDSNIIKCYIGTTELPDQNLHDILRTQDGIEFDLRYLALEE